MRDWNGVQIRVKEERERGGAWREWVAYGRGKAAAAHHSLQPTLRPFIVISPLPSLSFLFIYSHSFSEKINFNKFSFLPDSIN